MNKLPNLYKSKYGVYYHRTQKNGKDIRRSLFTKDFKTAKLLIYQHFLAEMTFKKFDIAFPNGIEIKNINTKDEYKNVLDLIDRLDLVKDSEDVEKLAYVKTARAASPTSKGVSKPSPNKAFKMAETINLYLTEKKFDNVEKTLREKKATYDEFKDFLGAVSDINDVDDTHSIGFKNKAIKQGLSALRINKKISFLKDLFEYAINNKYYFQANPFNNIAISKKKLLNRHQRSYQAFTDDELSLIFGDEYKGFMNKPNYYWLPILALYSGARIEELASLKTTDVLSESETYYFNIEKAKNRNSIRKIPIHKKIIELGFLKYVDGLEPGQVFPELKPSANGYSRNCSRRFSDYLTKIGLKTATKTFHSFRATFINRMTYLNIHPALVMAIVGHYEQSRVDFSSAHFSVYQQNKPIQILKKEIDKLSYSVL